MTSDTPIEAIVDALSREEFSVGPTQFRAHDVLVPEGCALVSMFGKNYHITVTEVEG